MNWNNEVTKALRIDYPVIQAPMLGVTSPEMVAAISHQGGLGSLPVGGLSPDKTLDLIRKTKQLTKRPFAVNLFANYIPEPDRNEVDAMQEFLSKLCADNNLPYEKMDYEKLKFYSYTDQVQILLDEAIPIVSFTFGIPDKSMIQSLQEKGTILIGTATSVREAQMLDECHIDMICAQGIEAGGHRGTFIEDKPLPQVGLMSLVPQIIRAVGQPVIAAGAINDGKTIKAVFSLGAMGVQIGTAFIGSTESLAIDSYKSALMKATDIDSALTRAFSGRWARGIRNKFMEALDEAGITIPPYPIQNGLTTALRAAAQKTNNKDFTNLWSGQSAPLSEGKSSAEIFRRLVVETENIMTV